ncbi:bifunctional diguanylate cyclase/phosphodiesterase [Brevibacillus agri]|uniref:bifunctional diguanylate cyclase/phosphodiesterase n=1 Tax=Brevibacillus agri TaxID=51101 RepID=UPI001EE5A679|nr:bifunctional diguanylate cyclase/phosphodiesterase [Brevibacillus agri]MCG5249951.1 EAL and GGDEF domain-containing protein [Brevibacillus agri]
MLSTLIRRFRCFPYFSLDKRQWMKTVIRQEINKGRNVVLFYVDIVKMTEVEQRYGDTSAKRVLHIFEGILPAVARQAFEIKGRILAIQKLWGDDFAIYVSFGGQVSDEDCRMLSIHFQEVAERQLNRQVSFVNREDLRVHIGYAPIAGHDIVREMYTSVKHAVHMAKYGITSEKYTHMTQFHKLLAEENVHMHFMPIVHLPDGHALGWEALARGPQNSPFATPATLFSYAEETDTVFRLEHICRKRALEQLRYLNPNEKLFINLDPRAIDDPFLLRGKVQSLLANYGLNPHNIVFEITERHAITNYAVFRKIIEEYRKKGYLIAVDDAGAGYSSLESITEIYPDFIKLDMSLIRNIDVDSIKQALLETFVSFAEKVNCKIIAEGIETERELETLMDVGVVYGQGYFLGKPDKGMAQVSGQAMNFLRYMQEKRRNGEREALIVTPDMTEILAKTICVEKHVRVRRVHEIFEQNQRIESVVVLEEGRPIGLVMRFSLYQILGGQYGIALYYERPVSHIMNTNPLKAGKTDRLDEVAKRAMARDAYHLYDVVIIVGEQNEYLGIVTVQNLLDKMASIKLEMASSANPLTGLPGNVQIERELNLRIKQREAQMVIYCDLDRFKWFNDRYGFEVGDQIIVRTANLLREASRRFGSGNDFIGHIGGDDFILITSAHGVDALIAFLIDSFSSYFADIYEKCRMGDEVQLSMSMAGVDLGPDLYASAEAVARRAADVKKTAKSHPGTVFVHDRECEQQTGVEV